ncbi:MAG: hypothetical protein GF329_17630 [Candidatus Lokiarchaeota archaeon]|nr:hypothetical protein [Candidatus Lokiarchaeota archaeon]
MKSANNVYSPLKTALYHDIVPKLGGVDFLRKFIEEHDSIYGKLLQLYYQWHELRKKTDKSLVNFVKMIETQYDNPLSEQYHTLSLAGQLAASITRTNIRNTYSRYVVNSIEDNSAEVNGEKVDFLGLSKKFIQIDSFYKLWKTILKSKRIAMLNESFDYADQSLSIHLLLIMAFMSHLIKNKPVFIMVKIVPKNKKRFIKRFWF